MANNFPLKKSRSKEISEFENREDFFSEKKRGVSNSQENSFIKNKKVENKLTLLPQQNSPGVHYSESIALVPKVLDKKNVLKRISFYVKSIIFNNEWISRTSVLNQIYAIDKMDDPNEQTKVSLANLKRRVYDSINVLVASQIVAKKVGMTSYKKEYFYNPFCSIDPKMVELKS